MDGVSGTIKHWVFCDVKSKKFIIKDAKHFAPYAVFTCVSRLDFFRTSADHVLLFHVQWYPKDGDPDVCGHDALPLAYDPAMTYGYCRMKYQTSEEWFDCKLCEQWFHEDWFYKLFFLKELIIFIID